MNLEAYQSLLRTCDQLDTLLASARPANDPTRLQAIQTLCTQLKGWDGYLTEKANNLANYSAMLLSARKHQQYPGGAEALSHQLRQTTMQNIRERLERLHSGA